MEKTPPAYCLLCAQLKSFFKLIHVEKDTELLHKTEAKLERLNILYENFKEISSKTICLLCIESLNRAAEFVFEVENAQKTLKELLINQIKIEDCSFEVDQKCEVSENKSDCSITIKEEFDAQLDNSIASENRKMKEEHLQMEINVISDNSDDFSVKQVQSDNFVAVEITNNSFDKSQSMEVNEISENSNIISLKHSELSWNDYPCICAYCETQFASIEELKIHSMKYHQCCNAFKCKDCNKRKFHLKLFIVHVKSHRKYLKLLCYKCNKKFQYSYQLHRHMKKDHAPKSDYVCLYCNTEFHDIDELNEHSLMFNQDDCLTCGTCQKTFKTNSALNSHLLIHTNRKREHTCGKCGKGFLNKSNLSSHMIMHDNVRPYKCKFCIYSFKTSRELKDHEGTHNDDKPHRCDQCGRGFRLQRYLNSHRIMHTDLLPHVCSYCNKKFRFKTRLNQHLCEHSNVKPYSCDICQKDFSHVTNYNKHMKRKH